RRRVAVVTTSESVVTSSTEPRPISHSSPLAIASVAAPNAELEVSARDERLEPDPAEAPPPPALGTTSTYSLGAEGSGRKEGERASATPAHASAEATTRPAATRRLTVRSVPGHGACPIAHDLGDRGVRSRRNPRLLHRLRRRQLLAREPERHRDRRLVVDPHRSRPPGLAARTHPERRSRRRVAARGARGLGPRFDGL